MAETYDSLVEDAKRRLNESLAEAAADAVVIAERFVDRSLRSVVMDITEDWPETFKAVYSRSKRIRTSTSAGNSGGPSTESDKAAQRHARRVAKDPIKAADLVSDPEVRNTLRKALDAHDRQAIPEADRKAADAQAREYAAPLTKAVDQARADSAEAVLLGFVETIRSGGTPDADLSALDDAVMEYQLARSELQVGVA